jgi:ACS family hexuronate transporter-like MFS transporter
VFTFCYAAAYIGTGWAVDRFGVRAAYAMFFGVWSLATLAGGLSRTLSFFTGCRAVLGLSEPAHAPTTIRVGVLWFPPERRAFLMSVAAWGGTIGAVAAPPLISWMALSWGWRSAFIIPGVLGLILAGVWWLYYRDPAVPQAVGAGAAPTMPWKKLWSRRALWGIVLARLVSDPVWYFCLFWMPGYFQEQRGLSLREVGIVGWIPFLAGNLGALACAAISDRMVLRYRNPAKARLALLVAVSCLGPLACVVPFAPGMGLTLALLSVVAIVCIGWFAVLGPLVTDLFPAGNSASVWAIAGAFGAVGAIVSNFAIGRVSSMLGTERMFLVLGILHLAALCILLFFVKTDRKADLSSQAA